MDMMSRLSDGYSKLFTLSGRATRGQFWTFFLANLLVLLGCLALCLILPDSLAMSVFLFGLVTVSLGNLSAAARRLHDTNRSGWWLLGLLVPFGPFVVFYLLAQRSVRGPTRYDAHTRTPSHPSNAVGRLSKATRALGS